MTRITVKAIVAPTTNPARDPSRASRYYYRARYYDPSSGKFLREDPLRFAVGKNFYRYVKNNPVKRKDPLGLWQLTVGGGDGIGILLTVGYNGGQWNAGGYWGVGEGAFAS